MKMTRNDLIEFWNYLFTTKHANEKHQYFLIRNRELVKDAILEVYAHNDYTRYDHMKNEYYMKHCVKEGSAPKIVNGSFVFAKEEDKELAEKEFEKYIKENPDIKKEYEAKKKEIDAFLAESVDVPCHKIKKEFVPDKIDFFERLKLIME